MVHRAASTVDQKLYLQATLVEETGREQCMQSAAVLRAMVGASHGISRVGAEHKR